MIFREIYKLESEVTIEKSFEFQYEKFTVRIKPNGGYILSTLEIDIIVSPEDLIIPEKIEQPSKGSLSKAAFYFPALKDKKSLKKFRIYCII